MLDYTLVLVCSEISDGNTHSHDNMLFLASGGWRALCPRAACYSRSPPSDLLVSIAHAMNQRIPASGQASTGLLPGSPSG